MDIVLVFKALQIGVVTSKNVMKKFSNAPCLAPHYLKTVIFHWEVLILDSDFTYKLLNGCILTQYEQFHTKWNICLSVYFVYVFSEQPSYYKHIKFV